MDDSVLNMSDEEFSSIDSGNFPKDEPEPENNESVESSDEKEADEDAPGATNDMGEGEDPQNEDESDSEAIQEPSEGSEPFEDSEPEETEAEGVQDTEDEPTEGVDYKSFYEKVMAPFKANGKTIKLDSPDDAIALMQMGANYTRKMQEMSKVRKYIMMLENNQLLDESKLAFLIDVNNKDPEAIKKLLKDADIDPLDIDTSTEPSYKGGKQHIVSDQEAALVEQIKEVRSLEGGNELIQSLQAWDGPSKDIIWNNPELLKTFHHHWQNGMYDRIVKEIERLQTLGQIGASYSFIPTYKAVGDAMLAQGAFNDILPQGQQPARNPGTQQRTPVASRPQKTTAKSTDNQRAKAAAPPRSTPKRATRSENPLSWSDDEFLKRFEGKV